MARALFLIQKSCVFVQCLHHTCQNFLAGIITPCLKLCIKQVESCSNWSELVGVISRDEESSFATSQQSQMQLGTKALWSSGGVSIPPPHALGGQTQCRLASFLSCQRASARLAAIHWEVDSKNLLWAWPRKKWIRWRQEYRRNWNKVHHDKPWGIWWVAWGGEMEAGRAWTCSGFHRDKLFAPNSILWTLGNWGGWGWGGQEGEPAEDLLKDQGLIFKEKYLFAFEIATSSTESTLKMLSLSHLKGNDWFHLLHDYPPAGD